MAVSVYLYNPPLTVQSGDFGFSLPIEDLRLRRVFGQCVFNQIPQLDHGTLIPRINKHAPN